jgi:hypothetical protein
MAAEYSKRRNSRKVLRAAPVQHKSGLDKSNLNGSIRTSLHALLARRSTRYLTKPKSKSSDSRASAPGAILRFVFWDLLNFFGSHSTARQTTDQIIQPPAQ